MKSRFDITIVGGGITGLTTAALLASCDQADAFRIRLIDAAARPMFCRDDDVALRVSAIANGSAHLLDSIGVWPTIEAARVSPFDSMYVWDAKDEYGSDTALRFAAAEFAVAQLGFIVENVLIQHALLERIEALDVELQFETRVEALPNCDLVIAADGARSPVRELAGIATHQWPYEQTALVTHLTTERHHNQTALQRFLNDGPLGMLPLADGRISVVWSTKPDIAQQALKVSDDELGRILTEASDRALGELTVAGPRGAFPLCAQHAEQYVQQGVALIGDAAHAIHPLAGQGANLGLQDAAALAKIVSEAVASGLHPGDRPVLRRYERARKAANLTMLHSMTGLNRLFTTDSKVVGELRSAGMRIFNRSGPIREAAVKIALGVN